MSEPIQTADPIAELRAALAGATAAFSELEKQLDAHGKLIRMSKGERYRVKLSKPRKGKDAGMWCLRIYGPGISAYGKRERTDVPYSRATKARALGLAKRRSAQLNDDGRTLLEVYGLWRASRKKLSPFTVENHQSAERWLEDSPFAGLVDGELSAARVLTMRDDLVEGRKTSTAKLYLGLVRQAWQWAYNREEVAQAWPSGLPKWTTPLADRTRKNAYTPDELYALLSYLQTYQGGHYLGLGWFLAETAARIRVTLQLRVQDVTVLEDGSADVALGRGPESRTKTGIERRAVISPALVQVLDLARPPEAYLFPSARSSGRPIGRDTFNTIVRAWLESVGLKGLRDVHSLRRRAVCELHGAGVPTEKGRRITGHRSREVYLSYAERTDYDLSAERRILWLRPEGIRSPIDPNGSAGNSQDSENRPMQAPGAPAPRSCSGGSAAGPAASGLQANSWAQSSPISYLRAQLVRRSPVLHLPALLRTSFGGGAVE